MQRTRIKFCGLTRAPDVAQAVDLGVDAIGLVFYPASSRAVDTRQAALLADEIPPFVALTGLFVNAEASHVAQVLAQVPLDLLQFHGDESDSYCRQFGRPYIKAVRVAPETDLEFGVNRWPGARGLLLDAWHPQLAGGTGTAFDWQRIPVGWRSRVILAGGLTPERVPAAIREIRPYGLDVSGGIENSPGIKDAERMQAFIHAVRQEDSRL